MILQHPASPYFVMPSLSELRKIPKKVRLEFYQLCREYRGS